MAFDLFQSRRNYNEPCKWWSRNESDDYDEDVYVYKRIPTGTFFAKEVNAETDDNNIIGGIFMIDRDSVTIVSPDNLDGIKDRDWVEYQGNIWRVDSVQKRKARMQNSEFVSDRNVSHYWYLSLIKGK